MAYHHTALTFGEIAQQCEQKLHLKPGDPFAVYPLTLLCQAASRVVQGFAGILSTDQHMQYAYRLVYEGIEPWSPAQLLQNFSTIHKEVSRSQTDQFITNLSQYWKMRIQHTLGT